MDETIVELDGQRLSYEIQGDGDPVVTLTNLAPPPQVWPDPYVPKLTAAGHQVAAVRHLGPADTIDRIVGDMAALIEHLELERVDLWGYSQGGMFAQELALARPDLVRSAVLMATLGRKSAFSELSAKLYERLRAIRDSDPETAKAGEAFMALLSFAPRALGVDALIEMMASFASDPSNYPEEAMQRSFAVGRAYENPLERLAAMRVPCLVVGFEFDLMTLAAGNQEVAEAIPGARYVEIAGAGHAGIASHTDEVFEHVLKFFAENAATSERALGSTRPGND